MLWNYCKNVIELLLLLYQNHRSLGSWATSFKSRCSVKKIIYIYIYIYQSLNQCQSERTKHEKQENGKQW